MIGNNESHRSAGTPSPSKPLASGNVLGAGPPHDPPTAADLTFVFVAGCRPCSKDSGYCVFLIWDGKLTIDPLIPKRLYTLRMTYFCTSSYGHLVNHMSYNYHPVSSSLQGHLQHNPSECMIKKMLDRGFKIFNPLQAHPTKHINWLINMHNMVHFKQFPLFAVLALSNILVATSSCIYEDWPVPVGWFLRLCWGDNITCFSIEWFK